MDSKIKKVDHSALKTNQASIITLSAMAFIFDAPWLAGVVAGVMALGTVLRTAGFSFVYRFALKPLNLVKPDILWDHPEPHLFAQGFGALVLGGGVVSLAMGFSTLGWGLVWFVVALASLNLFGGFCVGCAFYYWLSRLGIHGFTAAPPKGTVPGMRPKERPN